MPPFLLCSNCIYLYLRPVIEEQQMSTKHSPGEPLPQINCPNCGAVVTEEYCGACGQKRISKEEFSLTHFVGHAVHEMTHFDAKFFKSFLFLFTKPGKLTADYLAGRRSSYMQPMQLFIIANLLFFLATHFMHNNVIFATPLQVHEEHMSYSRVVHELVEQKIARQGISHRDYEKKFNLVIAGQAKTLVIIMVPLLALVLLVLYYRKHSYFVQHLIFSLHFFSFLLLSLITVVPLLYVSMALITPLLSKTQVTPDLTELFFITSVSATMFLYLFNALRKVYEEAMVWTTLKTVIAVFSLMWIFYIYRITLFFSVYLFT